MTYEYLKKYDSSYYQGVIPHSANVFYKITEDEILDAEELLGYRFPDQLREFYREIGRGDLTAPHNPPINYRFGGSNEILHPMVVARFTKGIYEWEGQDRWIHPELIEYKLFEEGDMFFFDASDSNYFMVLKPYSDNPNAVYTDTGILIEQSFEKFIWRLYYESPCFYDEIVQAS